MLEREIETKKARKVRERLIMEVEKRGRVKEEKREKKREKERKREKAKRRKQ